jgi:hypothetical protein
VSTLEPVGESGPAAVDSLAALLRSQSDDMSLYAGFLFNALEGALPPDMLTVSRKRGLRDRLNKTDGDVVEISVLVADRRYTLHRDAVGATPHAVIRHVVGGVVLSSEEVALDQWTRGLAAGLLAKAGQNEAVRDALARLIDSGGGL